MNSDKLNIIDNDINNIIVDDDKNKDISQGEVNKEQNDIEKILYIFTDKNNLNKKKNKNKR